MCCRMAYSSDRCIVPWSDQGWHRRPRWVTSAASAPKAVAGGSAPDPPDIPRAPRHVPAMSAAPGDTATSSTRSPIRTTRNMPRGSSGSEATSIPTAQMLRHSLRPCTASQKSGTAAHCPVSGPDPGSSADGYLGLRPSSSDPNSAENKPTAHRPSVQDRMATTAEEAIDLESDEPAHPPPTVWVEKTLVQGRPDRVEGPDMLGAALWSPQRAADGRDLYANMREVKLGDLVLHLTDNEAIIGLSLVAGPLDDTFRGVAGTAWA